MAEETEENLGKEKPVKVAVPKKKGGWFQKVPTEILLTPGGIILIFFAFIIEIVGILIPIPIIGFIIELPLVIIFNILLITIAKVSIKSLIMPHIIEFFFPFLPTWLIKIFV